MNNQIKHIIAQETTKVMLENKTCAKERLADLEDMQKIFNQICKLFRDVIKEKKLDIGFSEKPEVSDPAVSSSPSPGDAPASRTHTVVKGDTFWDLARKYYNNPLKWKDIQSANLQNGKLIPPRRLPIGTALTIPG